MTKDGVRIELVANIGKPEDLEKVLQSDGEGVGLFSYRVFIHGPHGYADGRRAV